MKKLLILLSVLTLGGSSAISAQNASININSKQAAGIIDEKLYGQLFEHIYFAPNNGAWQELIFERSFEPEMYPGINPNGGYFDGWYADDDRVLHAPARNEQPIPVTAINTDNYEITMDINWRAYKLAKRSWSGGLMDIRIAFKNQADGSPYFFRIHDPLKESKRFTPAQTEAQINAQKDAETLAKAQIQETQPNFSISTIKESQVDMGNGRVRRVRAINPLVVKAATAAQINDNQEWHKLRLRCQGPHVKAYWDDKLVISTKLDDVTANDLTIWVNFSNSQYRNIKVTSLNGKEVYFDDIPDAVKTPSIAQQWEAFGNGKYELVKDDAINGRYSQKITAVSGEAGLKPRYPKEYLDPKGIFDSQNQINVIKGEKYIGSIYAKGDGKATLSIALKNGQTVLSKQVLGKPGSDWKKYEFELQSDSYNGGADFSICVEGGTVQVDQASMTTQTGLDTGGFRPDLLQAVKELHPTLLRWPGGGYAAQYNWKWGIGPQEQRKRWDYWQWMDYDQNAFGTDEFIRYCREIDCEPVIVVSLGFEEPASEYDRLVREAAEWVAYCNEPATGKWGSVRAANGHPEPYNVKYWEIDNEMWEMGIERYEKCVHDFTAAMREVDPDIKIVVCGGFAEDEDFLMRSGSYFDYMSLHHYEQQGGYQTGPARLKANYEKYAQMISKCPNPNIKLFISEWNLQSIDWRTGLFAGGFLNMCENTPVVEMCSAALFMRRIDMPDWNNAFINFDYKDYFKAPNAQVTELWHNNFSKYRLAYTGDTADLSLSVTMSENGRNVIVKIVNATDKAQDLTINGDWNGIASANYTYFAPGDLMVANSIQNKNAVEKKFKTVTPSDNAVKMNIEPLSAGVLVIEKVF